MLRASWHHQGCTFRQQARRLQAGMPRAAVPGSRRRGGCTLPDQGRAHEGRHSCPTHGGTLLWMSCIVLLPRPTLSLQL